MGSEEIKIYTGPYGILSAAGQTVQENFDCALSGRSGCVPTDKGVPLGLVDREVLGNRPDGFTFLERMFIRTIGEVTAKSGVSLNHEDTLLIISSTKGNIEYLTGQDKTDHRVYLWDMASRIGRYFTAANEPLVVSNACISGLSAVIVASRLIRAGKYKNIIVAGGDTVTDFVLTGFASFKSLSTRLCRPYDALRDGLTLGEGCGSMLVTSDIELAGECPIEIAGGAISNDANHISGPSRTGEGLYFAIRDALCESGLEESRVDFINGHGTATVYNDEMESKAFALAGLDKKPLNSLKPLFGHTLGAAGILELIMCIEQLRNGVILGTPGFETCGTSVPLNVSPGSRKADLKACLKTASGFGGCNAAIVLTKAGYAEGPQNPEKAVVQTTAQIEIEFTGEDFAGFIRELYKALGESNMKFYKMDDLCKLGYVAATQLLKEAAIDSKYSPDKIGIVLYGNSSSLDSDKKHQNIIKSSPEEGASPAVFVYTLANIAAGEISIRHRIQGENTCFIFRDTDGEFTEKYARRLVENGYLNAVVCGYCELFDGKGAAHLKLIETKLNVINGEPDERAQGAAY